MLADNLILLRGLKGLTQEQAAEIAGVTRQSYSKWEQGETVPDIEKCDRLARHYGVTLDALLHDPRPCPCGQAPLGCGDTRRARADRHTEGCAGNVRAKGRRPTDRAR